MAEFYLPDEKSTPVGQQVGVFTNLGYKWQRNTPGGSSADTYYFLYGNHINPGYYFDERDKDIPKINLVAVTDPAVLSQHSYDAQGNEIGIGIKEDIPLYIQPTNEPQILFQPDNEIINKSELDNITFIEPQPAVIEPVTPAAPVIDETLTDIITVEPAAAPVEVTPEMPQDTAGGFPVNVDWMPAQQPADSNIITAAPINEPAIEAQPVIPVNDETFSDVIQVTPADSAPNDFPVNVDWTLPEDYEAQQPAEPASGGTTGQPAVKKFPWAKVAAIAAVILVIRSL